MKRPERSDERRGAAGPELESPDLAGKLTGPETQRKDLGLELQDEVI